MFVLTFVYLGSDGRYDQDLSLLALANNYYPTHTTCNVRRISAHKIYFFVHRARDVAHPGSGSPQSLLRIRSGWLTLITVFGRLRRSMLNCFNFSRVSPELVTYVRIAKMHYIFKN